MEDLEDWLVLHTPPITQKISQGGESKKALIYIIIYYLNVVF